MHVAKNEIITSLRSIQAISPAVYKSHIHFDHPINIQSPITDASECWLRIYSSSRQQYQNHFYNAGRDNQEKVIGSIESISSSRLS
mmetsp:Transcript_14913/g.31557  ORF Transcript_14913/g.31557 Transcript_14913/m.31557 type:complete len:86 (-) Transcript_14913:887-1144(-)